MMLLEVHALSVNVHYARVVHALLIMHSIGVRVT